MPANENLASVRRYLQALSSRAPAEEVLGFFSPDVVQEEMPNRLKPHGDRRRLPEMQRDYERGLQMMASQRYEIQSELADAETVVVEVHWTGLLALAVAHLQLGAEMRAQCAIFFQFQNGKILHQRNYDSFEPF